MRLEAVWGDITAELVDAIVNDPVVSASFSVWGPLLEGTPTLARPAYYWEKRDGEESLRFEEGWRGE